MTGEHPPVSVIVPTWHRAKWLDRCLAGIDRQDVEPLEVLVVGRDEDRDAREVCRRCAADQNLPLTWTTVETPGHIPPVQRGLELARGELVAFLDDDAEPRRGWLGALVEPFVEPTVACVGGRVEAPGFDGVVHPDAGRIRWYGKHVGNLGALEAEAPRLVHGVVECNWAWRREVLDGLEFPPVFTRGDASMYGLDLCLQARAAGHWVVYQPTARVIHHLAPRDGSLDRADRAGRTVSYSRNYTWIALQRFRGIRRMSFPIWWWLVGERGSYGLLAALVDAVLQSPARTGRLLGSSLRGKWQGVQAWWDQPCR